MAFPLVSSLAEAILPVVDGSQAPLARKPPSLRYDLGEGTRHDHENHHRYRQEQLFVADMFFGVISGCGNLGFFLSLKACAWKSCFEMDLSTISFYQMSG